jgi:hypothetical protein
MILLEHIRLLSDSHSLMLYDILRDNSKEGLSTHELVQKSQAYSNGQTLTPKQFYKRINQSRHSQKEQTETLLSISIWRAYGITDPRSNKEFGRVKMETFDYRRNRTGIIKRGTSTIHQRNHRRSRSAKSNN